MKLSVDLVVVRHGRTAWNAHGRFQGRTDVPLDELGRDQARAVARALAGERFDLAVTSDLSRARETAEIVLGERGPAPIVDSAFSELAFGAWEGLNWSEIVARDPALAEREHAPRAYVPPGGESFDDLCARLGPATERRFDALAPGARAALFTHAGVLHGLLRVLLGESEAQAISVRFAPASVTRFARADGAWRLIAINEQPALDLV